MLSILTDFEAARFIPIGAKQTLEATDDPNWPSKRQRTGAQFQFDQLLHLLQWIHHTNWRSWSTLPHWRAQFPVEPILRTGLDNTGLVLSVVTRIDNLLILKRNLVKSVSKQALALWRLKEFTTRSHSSAFIEQRVAGTPILGIISRVFYPGAGLRISERGPL